MCGPRERYLPISSYALIGDCHSTALISERGSIDWACLRRFDGGGAFCRLPNAERGGTFELCPVAPAKSWRSYVKDTNVLETTFETASGRVRVLDCFSMREGGSRRPYQQLLRMVEGVEGEVELEAVIEPRFDYGAIVPWLRHHPDEDGHSAVGGEDGLVLSSGCALAIERAAGRLRGRFSVREGARCRFSLVASRAHDVVLRRVPDEVIDRRLTQTIDWWRRWVARGRYWPEHREEVVRSALVLKALTCAPTGAVVAAPTTSLPEALGGPRNWDYRYSWIRDSTLTLSALLSVGHEDVARGFKRFIQRTTAGRAGDLQVMYGCYGERRLPEIELSHLDGYRGSRPVRVGNAAAEQRQLDVFGEILDLWRLSTQGEERVSPDEWRFLRGLVEAARGSWRKPDQGLWEMRGPPRHFVHSKVMCWVALDRGIEFAESQRLPCDLAGWRAEREEVRREVERRGVDPARGCFVQAFDSGELDASLLLLPIVGFVEAGDPRMLATVHHLEQELGTDGLLRRYRVDLNDGLTGREGFFLMTSFWLVEVLAMQGRVEGGGGSLRTPPRTRQRPPPLRGGVPPRGRPARELPPGLHPRGDHRCRPADR